jgi:hypothetical protein
MRFQSWKPRIHVNLTLYLFVSCYLFRLGLSSPTNSLSAKPESFTYNRTSFLLNGKPFQIIGGQMDPQRIPPEYWRDRLSKARAMGLNTIFSYVFWNLLEPVQGTWMSSEPANDIATFFRIAQQEGLHIVLRPGPYICGERDWGGFPSWLANVPGMVVRTYNIPFLNASKRYIQRLADDLRTLQVNNGGPLLMVQVENEYGSFGDNHNYTAALRDILRTSFKDMTLYTNDGGVDWVLKGGEVPNVLAEIDGDPVSGFNARDRHITDPTELGPLLDGEYYTWAPDQWGSYNTHNTTVKNVAAETTFVRDLDFVLGNSSASISMYMFHGGTNFGFGNGAMWQNRTAAFTTSYDYAAPLDESGRTTALFHTLRNSIQKYVPHGSIPKIPDNLPRGSIAEFSLAPGASLFDHLGQKTSTDFPLTMEAVGQSYGFILYEHTATEQIRGVVRPGDRPRDRVIVYVNRVRQGIIDSQYQNPPNIGVSLDRGDKLQLLVENLGRVDYHSRESIHRNYLQDPYKGIFGNVTVGDRVLRNWNMYPLPMENVSFAEQNSYPNDLVKVGVPPVLYRGTFLGEKPKNSSDPALLDTFLAVPNGLRGVVWVNGFNLGRFWFVGPQQSLYLPGTIIKPGQQNKVVVLELEPGIRNGSMVAVGMAERTWKNNPDVDCEQCV